MHARPGLEVSEIFSSIQGEGASAGQPCVFLRLAGCNLSCCWCDTRYAWDFARYDRRREVVTQDVAELARCLVAEGRERLVVTGGEPLLQQGALVALFLNVPSQWTIEIETNGTISPHPDLLARVDQWNVSPKLANSGEPRERRVAAGALACLRDTGRAWLKLVVAAPGDVDEAESLVRELAWPAARVLLMPQGASPAQLGRRGAWLGAAARQRGFGVSPRLHVERWGGARGQ